MKAGFVKLISFQQQKQKIRVLLEFVLLGSFCRMYIGLKLFYCVYSQGLGQQHFQLKIGVFFDVLLCHDIRVFASLSHLFMYSFILTKKLPFCRLLVFSLLLKLSLLENKIHLYFSISVCCQFSPLLAAPRLTTTLAISLPILLSLTWTFMVNGLLLEKKILSHIFSLLLDYLVSSSPCLGLNGLNGLERKLQYK